jgi:hypothetical protein
LWRLHRESEAENGGMWLALRYRRTMQEVRRLYPDRHTAIITECGMTQGVHPQGVGDVGPWHPSHPVSEDDYWASLMWYNDELMRDDYVLGACLFVVGAISPWESFEHLGGIVNRLARLSVEEPGSEPRPPGPLRPRPEPRPDAETPVGTAAWPSGTGEPQGHYLLLPPGVHWDWYAACRFYVERFHPSWGENPRDAARAAVVTCVNPGQETLETLRRLNPSARLDVIHAADPAELSGRVGERILKGRAYDG